MTAPVPEIRLSPHHDVELLHKLYVKFGRLHIADLLREEDARRIHDALVNRTPWNLTIIHKDMVYDVTPEQYAAMSDEQIGAMDAEVIDFARKQYEGRYRTLRLSDHGEPFAGDIPELTALSQFLNGEEFITFIQKVTGNSAAAYADAQATCYWPGDFLHPHYDTQTQKSRLFAYVMNLSPKWNVEWGGLLGFIDQDSHVAEAYTPKWNALNLLDVRLYHYVSYVAPFATEKRYSITGWIRQR
jgi:Rps23 Pro-64 3,4-dihydroxylase Tpa1-like proline 4-hydroxylase